MNNGPGAAPSQRPTTNLAVRTQMIGLGRVPEGAGIGAGMCAPRYLRVSRRCP